MGLLSCQGDTKKEQMLMEETFILSLAHEAGWIATPRIYNKKRMMRIGGQWCQSHFKMHTERPESMRRMELSLWNNMENHFGGNVEKSIWRNGTLTLPFCHSRAAGYYLSKETSVCWKCDMKLPTIPLCPRINLAASHYPTVTG